MLRSHGLSYFENTKEKQLFTSSHDGAVFLAYVVSKSNAKVRSMLLLSCARCSKWDGHASLHAFHANAGTVVDNMTCIQWLGARMPLYT